jgi:hypothetical protein
MQDAIKAGRYLAILARLTDWSLLVELWPLALRIGRLMKSFGGNQLSAAGTATFETNLAALLTDVGRLLVQWRLNHLESREREEMPPTLYWDSSAYGRKCLSPMRNLNCLFGPIRVIRWLYLPLDGLPLPALFPLEHSLGIVAGVATPALAEVVARLSVDYTQRQVLETLRERHHVRWGAETLRKVNQAVAEGISPFQHPSRVQMVLGWLTEAAAKSGPGRITLAVGRDGLMLPIRGKATYKEGATATVSVFNRLGQRLGTIYLGQMPEPGQETLSDELTRVLQDVLTRWTGPLPRLVYITDAGYHPRNYFDTVLSQMPNPHCAGRLLEWEWTVDYYHACGYITQLGEAIFGPGRAAHAWAAKMRRWLKDKPEGIHRVLRSAGALRSIRGLLGANKDYQEAYAYLRKHAPWMDYAARRRRRTPIGSGVTEAACKTIFSQRFKCSGMKWDLGGGAVILELRLAVRSRTWITVWNAMYASRARTLPRTTGPFSEAALEIAA